MSFLIFVSRTAMACAFLAATILQANAANVGTLTCTLSPSDTSPFLATEAKVSCHFDPIAGPDAEYAGRLKRLGVGEERIAKLVLIWAVLSEEDELDNTDLEGRYIGPLKGDTGLVDPGKHGLLGGNGDTITLRPLTADPDVPESWGISMLELQLAPVKT